MDEYWDSDSYKESCIKRLDVVFDIIKKEEIKGIVFEIGAGHGYMGELFSQLGCNVISTDAREEFVNAMSHKDKVSLSNFSFDTDKQDSSHIDYDIGISFGALYHVENPIRLIRNLSKAKIIIIESAICNSEKSILELNKGDTAFNQSMTGIGFYPSEMFIKNILEHFGYQVKSKEVEIDNLKRMVFVGRK